MIFVTVGTHFQGFERLVRAIDELAAHLDEPVVIQYGCSSYIPRHAEGFQWASSQRMEQLTRQARLVITHAAAGAIILALRFGKPVVVVPRRKAFGEQFDDHQEQLAEALDRAGWAIAVSDPTPQSLQAALPRANGLDLKRNASAAPLVQAVHAQLATWASAKDRRLKENVR